MKVSYNMPAIIANNMLNKNDGKLSNSLEKLSSGFKINHAKDNAAGLAIAKKMSLQLEGISKATQNASEGISVIEIADGALNEVHSILQRINELSVKSANGSTTNGDRELIQKEVVQLKAEMERISKDTEFNGQPLLDGSFEVKGYTDTKGIKLNSYASDIRVGEYELTINSLTEGGIDLTDPKFPADSKVEITEDSIYIRGSGGFEMVLEYTSDLGALPKAIKLDVTGIGDMRMQIGANEGQVLEINIPKVSTKNMGIGDIDLSTLAGANEALEKMPDALSFVSGIRARLGAYQNRLEHTVASLDVTSENVTTAYSRIMDVDMASEMTEYTKYQVLTQASYSMIAQANERPQQVLQLLQ